MFRHFCNREGLVEGLRRYICRTASRSCGSLQNQAIFGDVKQALNMFWHCKQKISKTTRISQPGTIHKFKGNAYDELRSFRQRAKTQITLSSSIEKRIKSGNGKFSIGRPFTKYYCSILRLKIYTMLAYLVLWVRLQLYVHL